MNETIIISLGGSLIVPDQIDTEFLKGFKELILSQVAQGKKFFIITGGGKVCRRYQDAAKELANPTNTDLDWIGVASLNLNAELIRVIFKGYSAEKNAYDPSANLSFDMPIIVCGANNVGASTDRGAIWAAKSLNAKKVINLSNTDYVYDSDPRTNPNAQKFEKLSWVDYRKLIPSEWNPGLSTPFDPIASKEAEEAGIEVAIMNGKPLGNLTAYLNGEKFQGTILS